jgi:hypothetical protein
MKQIETALVIWRRARMIRFPLPHWSLALALALALASGLLAY